MTAIAGPVVSALVVTLVGCSQSTGEPSQLEQWAVDVATSTSVDGDRRCRLDDWAGRLFLLDGDATVYAKPGSTSTDAGRTAALHWRSMNRPAMAILLALVFVPAARGAQPAVETLTIDDTTFGLKRPVWLYRSPGPPDGAKAPRNLFVFLQREYAGELAVPATLERLVAAGEIPPVIAVILDTSTERPTDIANRARFDRFVTADLLPWLRAKLGPLPDPQHVVIAGFSVGGLTAAFIAYHHPDVFGNVLAQSGAFWRGNEGADTPPEWLTAQFRGKPRLPLRFYLEVGSEETRRTSNGVVFVEANRRLRDVLAAKGYVVQYSEVPRNIHDPEHLRPTLPAGIVYLSRAAR